MEAYNAIIELTDKADPQHATAILDQFADYHPAVARAESGRAELILTLPAENLQQATTTALALVKATGHRPVRLEVLTTEEFDRRAGLVPIPDLVSVTEAAELLGVTRQAVLQRIDAGSLPAKRIGNGWAIARDSVA